MIQKKKISFNFNKAIRIAIVGDYEEATRVKELLLNSKLQFELAGFISPDNESKSGVFLGGLNQLNELVRFYRINELIFCSKNLSSSAIMEIMTGLEKRDVIYKIAPEESLFVIGSHDKNQSGDFYTIDVSLEINRKVNKINKRLLDIISSFLFLCASPVLILIQKQRKHFFKNLFQVLAGIKSWVGYCPVSTAYSLPEIKRGVFCLKDLYGNDATEDKRKELNLHYARSYHIDMDIEILLKNLNQLGRV